MERNATAVFDGTRMGSVADAVSDRALSAEPVRVLPSEPAADPASDISTPVTHERRPASPLVPALVVIAALWWGQVVLIPLVVSVLVSYALEPFVSRLESLHIARPFAVPLLLIALLGVTGFGIYGLRNEAVLLPVGVR
jgi:hypothetical protein